MSGPVVAADQLRLIVERIERLEEEKKGIGDDIKDVYAEAKATGYDVSGIRSLIKLRKVEPHKRREAQAILETYAAALGMDDLFTGYDGRVVASAESEPEQKPDPVIVSARGGKSFKQEVGEKMVEHFEQSDDGMTDVTITTGDGVVAFESKAAKARKAKVGAAAAGAA